jgi:hypothetical protein
MKLNPFTQGPSLSIYSTFERKPKFWVRAIGEGCGNAKRRLISFQSKQLIATPPGFFP